MTSTDSPRFISRYLDHYSGVSSRSSIRTPPRTPSQSLLDQEGNIRSTKKSLKSGSDAGFVHHEAYRFHTRQGVTLQDVRWKWRLGNGEGFSKCGCDCQLLPVNGKILWTQGKGRRQKWAKFCWRPLWMALKLNDDYYSVICWEEFWP
jgi:hypothetical protein